MRLDHVVRFWVNPALQRLNAAGMHGYDLSSEGLKLLLASVGYLESRYEALEQIPHGPAMGFCQMEPATLRDHQRWLHAKGIEGFAGVSPETLAQDPITAFALCRVHFARTPCGIPVAGDPNISSVIADIHKQYYNTSLGKANASHNSEILRGFLK